MNKYLMLCFIWLLLFFAPMSFGEWYDLNFHVYQSAISGILIYSFLSISSHKYVQAICVLALIVIAFNFIDYHVDFYAYLYDRVMALINAVEASLLILLGIRMYFDADSRIHKPYFKPMFAGYSSKLHYSHSDFYLFKHKKEKDG